jgi:hypothetical protein
MTYTDRFQAFSGILQWVAETSRMKRASVGRDYRMLRQHGSSTCEYDLAVPQMVRDEFARNKKRKYHGGCGSVLETLNCQHWPAPGSEDTELGVFMGPEVGHGEAKIYAGVQT